ncbi:MAG: HAMP domain-containing histidine kinase [Lachnospiraceae bacterium]|nr:HAMP domain-containing histidine kinase [Lachnospiraceae bacterium]MDD7026937.1 HAMP domain-containing sensor histidine kinase [Lachnospiraceae bacterium]MDY5700663.1 HAMP domain-containing sensor histidine kinase [Lachnospiraceae bacterium]
MKRSIRKQFAVIFIGMMTATVALCWILNSVFLETYYTREKQKSLLEVYRQINQAAVNETFDTEDFFYVTLPGLCGRYNINGFVVDIRTQVIKAFGTDQEQSKRQLWDNLIFLDRQQGDNIQETKTYKMKVVTDKRTNMEYLEIWGYLDSGDLFLLRTPLEGIRDSVKISNRFLAYIGTVAALTSGVVIWGLARKYTEPIQELVEISEKVANLDFNAKYTGQTDDEVGVLGANINHMSSELEKTISELKTANNELTKDIQQKTRVEEMRTEFLSNVSHELKTPIALIQGYAEGLRDGVQEDAAEREFYCNVIVDEAQKMNEMVKKLLNLNQLEFGNDPVTMERFDICALIYNYLQSAELLARQNEAIVEFTPVEPVYVWADEFKVEEVFTNYFTNALNHVEKGEDGIKRVSIGLSLGQGVVRIQVFNTGKPIPEESLPRIWDKFYKVDKARTRAYGGSGVGLSIVKVIMDSMNRQYGVENRENGVLFWFELEKA